MNEILNNMKTRRSIRKYKDEMIPDEIIDQIIEAGTYAASGRNHQASIIIAVKDQTVRNQLSNLNAQVMGVDSDPFYGAPVVLVVLAKKDWPTHVYDGSLVMGNLMLAAHSLNVGNCWIHRAKEVFEMDEGKEILKSLGIEDEYEGIGNCILGYVDGDMPEAAPRKDNYVYKI